MLVFASSGLHIYLHHSTQTLLDNRDWVGGSFLLATMVAIFKPSAVAPLHRTSFMACNPHSSRTYGVTPLAFLFPPLTSILAVAGVGLFLNYIFIAALLIGLRWYWTKRRASRKLQQLDDIPLEDPAYPTLLELADELPLLTTPDATPSLGAAQFEDNAQEQIFFPADEDLPPRFCPRCERTFPGLFEICPFDQTPLSEGRPTSYQTQATPLPRRFCPECDRRFSPSTRFCYFDGARLLQDFEEASALAPPLHFCRHCGFETFKTLDECPRDGQKLERLHPAVRDRIIPMIPMNHCYRCGHLGLPSETICPVDGTLMLPQLNARNLTLPSTGYGVRRRICSKCGAQFGGAAHFCAFDGQDLQSIN